MLAKTKGRKRSRRRSVSPKRERPRTTAPLIGYVPSDGCFVNLSGDYRYLSSGYYASQDQESGQVSCYPKCKDTLDAYVTPLFLEKARQAGLPVPRYYLTNEAFAPPALIDTVNPFMTRKRGILVKDGPQNGLAKSLTRNFTYAMCCQELPEGAQVLRLQTVLGWCQEPRFREAAAQVWRLFRVPVAVLRLIALPGGKMLFSGLEPLPWQTVGRREQAHLRRAVVWAA